MLHTPEPRIGYTPVQADPLEVIDLDRVLAAIRRQIWVVAICCVIGLMLGIAFVMSAVPLYTASTEVMIEKQRSRGVNELAGNEDGVPTDRELSSQVELLMSNHMAQQVVTRMKLLENPHVEDDTPWYGTVISTIKGSIGAVREWIMPSVVEEAELEAPEEERLSDAADDLRGGLDVMRVEESLVLRLSYTSSDPQFAAAVANAYGGAYLDDQLQSKYDATRRASNWLQDRIAELREQSQQADLAVQQFRNENGLLSTGGQLMSEQQLGTINAQLIAAQATTAEMKARLDQIRSLLQSGRTDAVVDDALGSSLITGLRSKYLEASRLEAEITRKLSADHKQVLNLQNEKREYERLIFEELGRIAESYESNYAIALQRQQSLQESLDRVTGVSQEANTSSVKLRELEREAETFRTLYNNFLQRYQEAIQQQSFPITDARIISQAKTPWGASYPKVPITVALAMILGLGAGVGIGAIREYRDRFFRTGEQIRSEIGLEYLGSVSKVAGKSKLLATNDRPRSGLWSTSSLNDIAYRSPHSAFAETLRNVKVAADVALTHAQCKVIGVVSSLPSEGKTTISANLASLIAMQGGKVLLVDGDLRNPGLARSLAKRPAQGLVEAVMDPANFNTHIQWDADGRLAVLPVGLSQRISHSSDLLASPQMAKILDRLRGIFDYIIVDLPPIGPVVDAKAFAHRVDGFVYVVEWGRTPRGLVAGLMAASPMIRDKCLGVVMNKQDESAARFYRSNDPGEYASLYGSYYKG